MLQFVAQLLAKQLVNSLAGPPGSVTSANAVGIEETVLVSNAFSSSATHMPLIGPVAAFAQPLVDVGFVGSAHPPGKLLGLMQSVPEASPQKHATRRPWSHWDCTRHVSRSMQYWNGVTSTPFPASHCNHLK